MLNINMSDHKEITKDHCKMEKKSVYKFMSLVDSNSSKKATFLLEHNQNKNYIKEKNRKDDSSIEISKCDLDKRNLSQFKDQKTNDFNLCNTFPNDQIEHQLKQNSKTFISNLIPLQLIKPKLYNYNLNNLNNSLDKNSNVISLIKRKLKSNEKLNINRKNNDDHCLSNNVSKNPSKSISHSANKSLPEITGNEICLQFSRLPGLVGIGFSGLTTLPEFSETEDFYTNSSGRRVEEKDKNRFNKRQSINIIPTKANLLEINEFPYIKKPTKYLQLNSNANNLCKTKNSIFNIIKRKSLNLSLKNSDYLKMPPSLRDKNILINTISHIYQIQNKFQDYNRNKTNNNLHNLKKFKCLSHYHKYQQFENPKNIHFTDKIKEIINLKECNSLDTIYKKQINDGKIRGITSLNLSLSKYKSIKDRLFIINKKLNSCVNGNYHNKKFDLIKSKNRLLNSNKYLRKNALSNVIISKSKLSPNKSVIQKKLLEIKPFKVKTFLKPKSINKNRSFSVSKDCLLSSFSVPAIVQVIDESIPSLYSQISSVHFLSKQFKKLYKIGEKSGIIPGKKKKYINLRINNYSPDNGLQNQQNTKDNKYIIT